MPDEIQLPSEVLETTVAIDRVTTGLVIEDDPGYAKAAALLVEVSAASKKIEQKRLELTRPLDASKKAIMDLFRGPLGQLEEAGIRIRKGMQRYNDAREEAARKERALQAAEARRLSQEAEAKRLAEMEEALSRGDDAAAEAIVEAPPVSIAAPAPIPEPPKVRGATTRTVWCFKVIDPGIVPLVYLSVDTNKIQTAITTTKGSVMIPGVHIWSEDRVVLTGR